MRILVAGGAGFIGGHLVNRLIQDGHDVVVIDNLSTGSLENVNPKAEFIQEDIRNINDFSYDTPYDRIYNLACPASPPAYQRDPLQTMYTCVLGTDSLLRRAYRDGARFLQASTSEIYGDPQVHPQREDYRGNVNPIGPRACYDEGKRAAETLVYDFERVYNVDVRVARIFNTYGPGMDPNDGRVISNFICQALRNEDITIYGNGSQTRSFCYVSDLVLGLIELMESDYTLPVNLGNPGEFTVMEAAEMILDKVANRFGSTSKIVFKDLPQDDPQVRRPDIKTAQRELNWHPTIPFAYGLEMTIDYFASKLGVTE